MLFSIGKDSAVMLHLAFHPSVPPFPLVDAADIDHQVKCRGCGQ